jgi:hypothetical protein
MLSLPHKVFTIYDFRRPEITRGISEDASTHVVSDQQMHDNACREYKDVVECAFCNTSVGR